MYLTVKSKVDLLAKLCNLLHIILQTTITTVLEGNIYDLIFSTFFFFFFFVLVFGG